MFKAIITITGKVLKKRDLGSAYIVTMLTKGVKHDAKNFPKFKIRKSIVTEDFEEGDFLTVTGSFGSRPVVNEQGTKKRVTCINIDKVEKAKSMSEQIGLNPDKNNKIFYSYENQIDVIGVVDSVTSKPNGVKLVSVVLPNKVLFVDYRKNVDYGNIESGDIVCIKGEIQTKNIALKEPIANDVVNEEAVSVADSEEASENASKNVKYRHLENYTIVNIEKVNMNLGEMLK